MRMRFGAFVLAWTMGLFPAVFAQNSVGFVRQPAEAVASLKATVGKPFKTGYVFVNGKYIKPPYKVERYGTIIRINGIQVTNPIVPWEDFVKTQAGATVTKTETPGEAPEAVATDATAEVAAQTNTDDFSFDAEDDSDMSLDDLFGDESTPEKKVEKKSVRPAPRPKAPTVTVTYTLAGEFIPNEQSRALLDRINKVRTRIDRQLRKGGYFCFGSRYSSLSGDASATTRLIAKLPGVMKRNTTREAFGSAMRQAGLTFVSEPLVDDFFRNRVDYFVLSMRLKAEQEDDQWKSLVGPSL